MTDASIPAVFTAKPLRLGFLGFRHGHILSLYKMAQEHPAIQIVAACEEDAAHAAELRRQGQVTLTHERITEVLTSVECDAVAVGDYYTRRGAIAIAALRAGKHVISDKPICTSLVELKEITALAEQTGRCISAQLDLRSSGALRAMRRLIADGAIGQVHTILATAQHPLLLNSRPHWYFEPGKHGGTLNDIAIHLMDLIPWLTERRAVQVVAARVWNARLPQYPHFQDAGQFMLRLDNGGGVLADVSYLAPDGCGYAVPQYWRVTCHGEAGVLESRFGSATVLLATSSDAAPRELPADPADPRHNLDIFLAEIADASAGTGLSVNTAAVLNASRAALCIQQAAEQAQAMVDLPN